MMLSTLTPRLTVVMSLFVVLTACSSHSNPLKTTEPEKAAKFLVAASRSAEKKLKIFNAPGGYYYGRCMQGKEKAALCNRLYQVMVSYASTTQAFQHLSITDLTNKTMFKKLKQQYKHIWFNTID